MVVCDMDVKPGGKFRWVWKLADGKEIGMGGTFREIVPNERIVNVEKFDDPWYPGEGLVTIAFAEAGGRTTVTTTVRYDTREIRDMVLKTPMTKGIAESYERLDELLAAA